MASEQTGIDAVDQLQNIRSEVVQVKGLSKFTVRLLIDDAKNRGSNLVEDILKKFTETKAKIYLLVNGFRSSREIGESVGIKQQSAHEQLQWLRREGLVDFDDPGSPKATYKKSGVEEVIGLSNRLKREFKLHDWLKKTTKPNAE